MSDRIDSDLEVETHDVFQVMQLTRGTELEAGTGADLVGMEPGRASSTHRHNLAETVLYFLEGEATVFVDDVPHEVGSGDRVLIGTGEFHSVSTGPDRGCRFISIQSPPILNTTTGFLDLEPRVETTADA
ncbi:MAG: cupin domain-containing protein [Actinomycetota bacterium]